MSSSIEHAAPAPDAQIDGAEEIGFTLPEGYNASRILFDNLDAGRGGKVAIYSDNGTVTYDQLARHACRIGNALLALGLRRQDRVLLFLDDTPIYPAALFGAMRAGLVPILINTLATPDLVRFFIEDSGARAVITDIDFKRFFDETALDGTACQSVLVAHDKAASDNASHRPWQWVESFSDELAESPTKPEDMAFWLYSSGSTGRPKGVVHDHRAMAYTVRSYADNVLKLRSDDICFSVPKIFFAYGFGNAISFPFSIGASSVLLAGRPTPEAVFGQVARHKPTVFFGLPTLYTALIKDPAAEKADFASVRLCLSAAEILSADVFESWKSRFGSEIVEGLGSTEALHIYLSNTVEQKKLGSAGKRVPGYELKLTDLDGAPVPAGQEGIMWVKGGSNATSYWKRPEKSAETMRDGWIYTGDQFVCDDDGFYFFRGRADDLIKVSGQWVYPLEIELALAEHPGVRECAVLAHEMQDRRMILSAFVSVNSGYAPDDALIADFKSYLKQRLLPYKYPKAVRYLEQLPKTGTGKIDRQALKARIEGDPT